MANSVQTHLVRIILPDAKGIQQACGSRKVDFSRKFLCVGLWDIRKPQRCEKHFNQGVHGVLLQRLSLLLFLIFARHIVAIFSVKKLGPS